MPCNPYALYLAISHQQYGETLDLAPGCTYYLPDALPNIKTELTIVGYHSTLTRTWDAGSFSLLTVSGGGCGGPSVINVNDNGDCSVAGLTVINVNFTDGGGYDTYEGGAINNRGHAPRGGRDLLRQQDRRVRRGDLQRRPYDHEQRHLHRQPRALRRGHLQRVRRVHRGL